jgi:hypothetical protein
MPEDDPNSTLLCQEDQVLCNEIGLPMAPNCTTVLETVGGGDSEVENLCTHLFAQPGEDQGGFETGDGVFTISEEEYWRSDPTDRDTIGYGVVDEATVVGLNLSEFTWNYIPGDKIGVVAEGLSSSPTKHDDASLKVMFAMIDNDCDVTGKGSYIKRIKGYDVEIPTATMDADSPEEMRDKLNNCLEENITDPREGSAPDKMDVEMSYYPENPFNDATGDGLGDTVTISATPAITTQTLTDLYYEWDIEYSVDGSPNPPGWVAVDEEDFQFLTPTQGNAQTEVAFRLNLSGAAKDQYFTSTTNPDVTYFRARVAVAENFDTNRSKEGRSQILFKVYSTENSISAYSLTDSDVVVGEDGSARVILNPGTGNQICDETLRDRVLCFVTQHEILALQIEDEGLRNFHWKLDDQTIPCDTSVSPQCLDTQSTNTVFVPVTARPGEQFTVSVSANDVSNDLTTENLGNKVEIAKTFVVVEPFVKIETESPEDAWPRYLGDYVDLYGEYYPEYSDAVFETFPENYVVFSARTLPAFADQEQMYWSVNGNPVMPDQENPFDAQVSSDGSTVSFVTNQRSMSLSVLTKAQTSQNIRLALQQIWGVSQFVSIDEQLEGHIKLEVVDPLRTAQGDQPFFASIVTNTPEYLLFLMRLVLTSGVLLFVLWGVSLVASIVPRNEV